MTLYRVISYLPSTQAVRGEDFRAFVQLAGAALQSLMLWGGEGVMVLIPGGSFQCFLQEREPPKLALPSLLQAEVL